MPQPTGKQHTIANVFVDRLATPYPPVEVKVGCKSKGWFMAESQEIKNIWEFHLATAPPSDEREGNRPGVRLLEPTELRYDVKEGENVAFFDRETKELVGLVVQGLVGDKAVLKGINGGVFEHLNRVDQMMRRSDPGRMGGVGYTSGARKLREFIWGQNMKKTEDEKDAEEHNRRISCYFAHIWTLIMEILPEEVRADYAEAVKQLGGIHMDGGARGQGNGVLKYKMVGKGVEVEYETAILAPPSGTCAKNYSRFTHNEVNLNSYCVSWTSHRSHSPEHGGNFYNASYGIRIPGRNDQVVVWKGQDYHGTTLPNLAPLDKNPKFNQSGMAFILSSELKGAFEDPGVLPPKLAGSKDNVSTDQEQQEHMLLNHSEVVAQPRETLAIIKRKLDTGTKPYAKDYEDVYEFEEGLPYADTKKDLVKRLREWVEKGKLVKVSDWWPVPKLRATLLECDGHGKVPFSKVLKKKRKREGSEEPLKASN